MKHNIKHIESLKLQNRLLWTFVYFCVLGGLLYITQDRVISPCSDSGCNVVVKTVYAQDSASELEQIVSYITRKFAPEGKHVVVQAIRIAYCESGIRSNALNTNTNGSTDFSIFQVNSIHTKRYGDKFKTSWKDNVDTAYKIYKSQGWSPWVCADKLGI